MGENFLLKFALLLTCITIAFAGLCPQVNHTVCNAAHEHDTKHKCACAVSELDEAPPPEASCNVIVKVEDEDFQAASITFNNDDTAEHHDGFDERRFRTALANSLRIAPEDVVILRAKCSAEGDQFRVQFVILKKGVDSATPHGRNVTVDSKSVVTRLQSKEHLAQLADLDVSAIEVIDRLIPVEAAGNNKVLGLMALIFLIAVVVSVCLAVIQVVRQRKYQQVENESAEP